MPTNLNPAQIPSVPAGPIESIKARLTNAPTKTARMESSRWSREGTRRSAKRKGSLIVVTQTVVRTTAVPKGLSSTSKQYGQPTRSKRCEGYRTCVFKRYDCHAGYG